ncbi:MAG: hypothetical protein GY750_11350 [Lentisphaerae bacterium]|nr:hypothetical protein [Lentisphaerota bacterium]MCP4102009.1 hypothetical protein [Lentisphaerota bacterium]
MSEKLTILKQNGWRWHIVDARLLDGWFDVWEKYCQEQCIKANPVRKVFTVDGLFHVKLEEPAETFRKIRSMFRPKAQIEFNIGQALEDAGVNVVKHLGWAQNGSCNMLLTASLSSSVSVHDYWMKEIVFGNGDSGIFLNKYAAFLKDFFASGFFHPDFHSGNILYSLKNDSFALVDVYGVSHPKGLSSKQRKIHEHIVFDLKYGMNKEQAAEFILECGIKSDLSSAIRFWEEGLTVEYKRVKNSFPKRLRQISENYQKFVNRIEEEDRVFLLKRFPIGLPGINEIEIPDHLNGNHYDVVQLPAEAANDLWTKSFLLNMLGFDHIQPIVFEEPNVLYFEKIPKATTEASAEDIAHFNEKAEMCGLKIVDTRLLRTANNRVLIEDIRQIGLT